MDVLSFPSPTKKPPSPHTTNHVCIFPFLCYFMAYNQKKSVFEAAQQSLRRQNKAYSAIYQHWDQASPQHSNKHTDTDTSFSKTLHRVLLTACHIV